MAKNRKNSARSPAAATGGNRWRLLGLFLLVTVVGVLWIWLGGRGKDSGSPGPTAVPGAVYLPAEFSAQEFLLLGGTQLVDVAPRVLVDVVRAAHDQVRILVLVGSTADRRKVAELLAAADLAPAAVELVHLPIRSMWVRDFGPITVVDGQGGRRLVDFHYRERRGNTIDDHVPEHIAAYLGLPRAWDGLLLEGGDFLTNGRGLCMGSTRLLARNEHYLQLEARHVVEGLAAQLGFEDLVLLPPLQGETTGHLDMFCALLAEDLCVVGKYDPAADAENAALLDQTAARLAEETTLAGPLRVERIVMPAHPDDVWRTYTNLVFAGESVLVPLYPDFCPELDEQALATYRRLLPDRRIVGIDASRLVAMRGVLRCITMNIPRGAPPRR